MKKLRLSHLFSKVSIVSGLIAISLTPFMIFYNLNMLYSLGFLAIQHLSFWYSKKLNNEANKNS